MDVCPSCGSCNFSEDDHVLVCLNCHTVLNDAPLITHGAGSLFHKQGKTLIVEAWIKKYAAAFAVPEEDIVAAMQLFERFRATGFKGRKSAEVALSLVALVSRHRLPNYMLCDYCAKVGMNFRKMVRVYMEIKSRLRLADDIWKVEKQVETVISRLYDPMKQMMVEHRTKKQKEPAKTADLKELRKMVQGTMHFTIESDLDIGRARRPVVGAAVVLTFLSLSSPVSRIDWDTLARSLNCATSTLYDRYKELTKRLYQYVLDNQRYLPWLMKPNTPVTPRNIHLYLYEILTLYHAKDAPKSTEKHISTNTILPCHAPSYLRAQQSRTTRKRQILEAKLYKSRPGTQALSIEGQLIAFLLSNGYTEDELLEMSLSHIRLRVATICDRRRAQLQGTYTTPSKNLDRVTVDESDMAPSEVAAYLKWPGKPIDPKSHYT
ncbi:uncharacterized protein BYT42DRAFT_551565 [Radiomyces spectabilis]|uniref:uncharacterized protein n=1 Tax=Radiomyces spectabilis TaxID=64574 RepID=UPI002220921A|nr:uncharacterized protein BYT42DRAFT_551565 [Radiomyces spectabilis]KAI8393585.1 hypothetical protein BYT42DRAFT_551565 [Radiomyces spectabilis]